MKNTPNVGLVSNFWGAVHFGVGFFLPTTACLRGLLRVLANFGESNLCHQPAGFTLLLHILSPSIPTRCRSKSGRHAHHPYINQRVTRGRINRFFCGNGWRTMKFIDLPEVSRFNVSFLPCTADAKLKWFVASSG